jgi:hypothetical protein
MPIRVRSKPVAARDASPMRYDMSDLNLPDIDEDESFREIIKKLSVYVCHDLACLPMAPG